MNERALLFTDVVDSTALIARVGDEPAAAIWAEHDRCARQLLAQHAGVEIDRTDGFFLLFDQVGDAAGFALAYHREIAEIGLAARVGLHHAAVTLRPNPGADIARGAKPIEVEGLAKPLAARIMSLARGGQTLLSDAARNALGDAPGGTQLQAHGHYRLKGVEEPQALFELGSESSAFTPPADTEKAYRVVRADELWRPLREVRHNLAPERDAFIGRSAELRQLALRLESGVRLLTALGVGGTGKTRLVRRYGLAWLGEWPGGVYFCDLSEARSVEGICFAVASALDVPLGKDDPVVQLGHAIAARRRCLVILDNFEQVVQHAPSSLARWLDRAGEASFVVTSRERLQLLGEEVFAVEPLALDGEAVELFATRARAQRPGFVLDDTTRAAVADIVEMLDGLPLAIELAAARVRVLSPTQIVQRLKDRFVLLAGARGAAARQATLQAAIDWSWDLLAPWEQAALAQCSVFEGGFTLEAAEAVLDLSQWPDAPVVMDTVQALVDKSLLRARHPEAAQRLEIDEPYFGMYLSIRAYTAAKLERGSASAADASRRRYGRFYARYGSEDNIESLSRHGGFKRRRMLFRDIENLVSACRNATAHSDLEIAVPAYAAACEVFEMQGPASLGIDLGRQLLPRLAADDARRATATRVLAKALVGAGRGKEAEPLLVESIALCRRLGQRRGECLALSALGLLHRNQGLLVEAQHDLEQALQVAREVGNRIDEGRALGDIATLHSIQGRLEEAERLYAASLAIHRETGNRGSEGSVLANRATLANGVGRLQEARALCEQALVIHLESGNRRHIAGLHGILGTLETGLGHPQAAIEHFAQALDHARTTGARMDESVMQLNLAAVHLDGGALDEADRLLRAALATARDIPNPRIEGAVLTNLGELRMRQGALDEAGEHLQQGEAKLRQVGDLLELAKLRCIQGMLHAAQSQLDAARAALVEAAATYEALGSSPQSELARCLDALRKRIG